MLRALFLLAPRVGLEPTTLRLTAACSTIELSRNNKTVIDILSQPIFTVNKHGAGNYYNCVYTRKPHYLRS